MKKEKKEKRILLDESVKDLLIYSMTNYEISSIQRVVVPQTHKLLVMKMGMMQQTFDSGEARIIDPKKGLFGPKETLDIVDLVFINTNSTMKIVWGTPTRMEIMDPKLNIPVSIGMNGSLVIKISNPRKFAEKLGLMSSNYSLENLKNFFREILIQNIKQCVASHMLKKDISFYDLWSDMQSLCDTIIEQLAPRYELYGVSAYDFSLADLIMDEELRTKINSAYEEMFALKVKGVTYKELRELDNKDLQVINQGGNNIFCPDCGKVVSKDQKFCSNCGHRFKVVCPSCGKEYPSETKFCSDCGTKLGE